MPILSGATTKSTAPATWSSADGFAYAGAGHHPLAGYLGGLVDACAYDRIYQTQLWPQTVITTLVELQMQLPLKVYQRGANGSRDDARSTPFGQVLAEPSADMDPVAFWSWFVLQRHVHGRAFALKRRDAGGRPVRLELIHPTRVRYGPATIGGQGPSSWWYRPTPERPDELPLARADFLYWRRPHPRHPTLALSVLEALRDTLEMEAAVQTSAKALFRRGGKHSMVLKTAKNFGSGTSAVLMRLADQYAARHGGPENHGRPLILEDGMEAVPLDMSMVDLEYIEQRKLHREETAAAFRMPAPAVGINDHSTFSNVREQNATIYRVVMPPLLQGFEAVLNFDLRDGRHGRPGAPDFGDAFYAEALVDGVLRGSPEERIAAHAQGIQTGQLTPAEARALENRPFIPGSDQLFVNSAMVTMEEAAGQVGTSPKALAELVQKMYLGTPEKVVISMDEAREMLRMAGADLPGPGPVMGRGAISAASMAALPQSAGAGAGSVVGPGQRAALAADVVAKAMGRLSRVPDLAAVDVDGLTAGLEPAAADVVAQAVEHVRGLGGDVAGLRRLIKELGQR